MPPVVIKGCRNNIGKHLARDGGCRAVAGGRGGVVPIKNSSLDQFNSLMRTDLSVYDL